MSYAVTIGTVQSIWVGDNPAPVGTVLFTGNFPANPIWDATILPAPGNIRQMTPAEIAAQTAANTPPTTYALALANLIDLLVAANVIPQAHVAAVQTLLGVSVANASPANIAASIVPLKGVIALVGGAATVACSLVTANSIIIFANQKIGGTLGSWHVGTITPGTGFTIVSSSPLDTSQVGWEVTKI
jgi:hypothetical protein